MNHSLIKFLNILLIFICLLLISTSLSGQEVEIHSNFFQPLSYSVDNSNKMPVMGNFGLSKDYENLLRNNPEALHAAKSATGYSVLNLVGMGLITAGAIVLLLDTLDQADDVESGNLPEEDEDNYDTALGLIIVGGAVGITGAVMAKNAIKESAQIYNRGQKKARQHSGIKITNTTFLTFNINKETQTSNRWKAQTSLKYYF